MGSLPEYKEIANASLLQHIPNESTFTRLSERERKENPKMASSASTTPVSSSSSHQDGAAVVVIVFISLGCVLIFCLCLFGLWLVIDWKRKRTVQGAEVIRADEHFKMKEDIVNRPDGEQAIVLSVEKDKHFTEDIARTEKEMEEIKIGDVERGESSSGPGAVLKP